MLSLFIGSALLAGGTLLAGCTGEQADEPDPGSDSEVRSPASPAMARNPASQMVRVSMSGAPLGSTHPLRDSLEAMTGGRPTGGPIVLADTFSVEREVATEGDSAAIVRVRVPAALTVNRTWEVSEPRTDAVFRLRVQDGQVFGAPRLIGWGALRRQVRRVEPDSADAIIGRLEERWSQLTGERPQA